MHLGDALSHKLAEWNERGLMRDLYDVCYMAALLMERKNTGHAVL